MQRRTLLTTAAAGAASLCLPALVRAQALEKPKLTIAVGEARVPCRVFCASRPVGGEHQRADGCTTAAAHPREMSTGPAGHCREEERPLDRRRTRKPRSERPGLSTRPGGGFYRLAGRRP